MADIVEFKSNEDISASNVKEILTEIINQANNVKDILVFLLDKNDDYILFNTNTLELRDKSFLIQMLQHDIMTELNDTNFESDEPKLD